MSKDAGFDEAIEQCTRAKSHALKLRQESRGLVQRLRENMHELGETASQAREIVRALKVERGIRADRASVEIAVPAPLAVPIAGITGILSSMSDRDLDQLAERLIEACDEATLQGDAAARNVIETALYQVGYTIAARVGPRVSGLVLN